MPQVSYLMLMGTRSTGAFKLSINSRRAGRLILFEIIKAGDIHGLWPFSKDKVLVKQSDPIVFRTAISF